jgi:hypothetical protein
MGSKAGNAAYLIRYQQTSLIIKLSAKVACLISYKKKSGLLLLLSYQQMWLVC